MRGSLLSLSCACAQRLNTSAKPRKKKTATVGMNMDVNNAGSKLKKSALQMFYKKDNAFHIFVRTHGYTQCVFGE